MMEGSARAVTVLAFLLGMPFIGYIAAAGVQWKENSALRQELLKELPDNVAAIESLTISGLCEHPGVRSDQTLNEVCSQNDNLGWMKRGAVFSATSGILLVGIIKLAGTLASKRRMLLLLLFSPGLHFTILAVSVLAVLDSVLGIAALYYGESALIGRVHIGIMLGFGIGAFVVVVSLIRAQLFAIRKASTVAIGKKLERTEYLSLCNFVEALADRMGAERPESMVAGLEPNFYVTEAEVTCLDGELRGRTLYISLPLCRILNLDEFAAIVAHELGHYKGWIRNSAGVFFQFIEARAQQ